jgi:hypothetical protein
MDKLLGALKRNLHGRKQIGSMAKITHDVCHHERPGEAKWLSRSMASMAA